MTLVPPILVLRPILVQLTLAPPPIPVRPILAPLILVLLTPALAHNPRCDVVASANCNHSGYLDIDSEDFSQMV
ncbi:hypothetical protein [Leptolyngbya iicbica]|uniref:Uncharacterized protein n=1 Tax=Lyngbya confervoides BDU141951 TaxID=1574623 RepID=A0A8T6QNU4_9CYAN|nr:hypothetical protein [Leptolyngbya sp. LK]